MAASAGRRLFAVISLLGLLILSGTSTAQDEIDSCFGETPTIVGTPGKDDLKGTSGRDVVLGRGGDDTIDGRGGDDVICGEGGNDKLIGGPGDDILDGDFTASGKDMLIGGSGSDRLFGGLGDDVLKGGSGDDELQGGSGDEEDFHPGKDKLYGGPGKDVLNGGHGDDKLYGGRGDDQLEGYFGDDKLFGGPGSDLLDDSVGVGKDLLVGGGGDDTLHGQLGDDRLEGGSGNDELIGGIGDEESTEPGNDLLLGGPGADRLIGGPGDDQLYGGAGADQLDGGHGNDLLDGGSGNDMLSDPSGDDRLFGDEGNDTLFAGDGNDRLFGGPGDDRLFGEAGDDELFGGGGNDLLNGGPGTDRFDGGPGSDTIVDEAEPPPVTLTSLIDAGDRAGIRTWAAARTVATLNSEVAALDQAHRDHLAAVVLDTNATGEDRDKMLRVIRRALGIPELGFYAEIWSYTFIEIVPPGFFGTCNHLFLDPSAWAGLSDQDAYNVLMHESFHSFNCVNGGPVGSLDEGSAIWITLVPFDTSLPAGESLAETTYGTKLYAKVFLNNPNLPITAPLNPTQKLLDVYAYLAAHDPSQLPWNSTDRLVACFNRYFADLDRNVPFDTVWLPEVDQRTQLMLADSECKPV